MQQILKVVLITAGASVLFGAGMCYANWISSKSFRRPRRKMQEYNMKKKNKGKFLIINNSKFTYPDVTERHGTDKDAEALEKLFGEIGFEIVRKNDLTSVEILGVFRQFAANETYDSCCFGAAILSHGGSGGVYGTDWKLVPTEDIMDYFSESNCPALKEKPKLFFIQACQKSVSGVEPESPHPNQPCFVDAQSFSHRCEEKSSITLRPDFFLAVATPLGYLAYRCVDSGTFFIRAIVKIFREHAAEEHLLHLMTMVTEDVRSKRMQVPVWKSSLSKLLFFNPDKDLSLKVRGRENNFT